ncbi:hypothetical protein CLORY_38940 [Clostridium oryzae]|uniref:Uncharacterized protein n=1 Tax=Clostridium oryzae TaxID=1450648 RepID=A0A1V4ICZ7_9CLOT|nr:hypothetical protein CLORY_38940 [Clostridium oryzae]
MHGKVIYVDFSKSKKAYRHRNKFTAFFYNIKNKISGLFTFSNSSSVYYNKNDVRYFKKSI